MKRDIELVFIGITTIQTVAMLLDGYAQELNTVVIE